MSEKEAGISEELEETDKAWLACAIDSEGSVMLNCVGSPLNRGKRVALVPVIQVTNNNIEYLEITKYLLGTKCKLQPKDKNSKTYSVRLLAQKGVERVLLQIFPYLIVKSLHAEILLNFLRRRHEKWDYDVEDWKYVILLRALNQGITEREAGEQLLQRFAGYMVDTAKKIEEAIKELETWE